MRTEAMLIKRQETLEAIKSAGDNGLTLLELVDITGIKYHTLYNYVRDLLDNKSIEQSPKTRNRAVVFVVPNASTMPKYGKQTVWALLKQQAKLKDEGAPDSALGAFAYRVYLQQVCLLFNHAAAKQGGNKVPKQALLDIRATLNKAKAAAEELVEAIENLIEDPRLTNPEQFADVLLDDKFCPVPSDELNNVLEAVPYAISKAKYRL